MPNQVSKAVLDHLFSHCSHSERDRAYDWCPECVSMFIDSRPVNPVPATPAEVSGGWDRSGLKEACQRALQIGRTKQEMDIQLVLDMLLRIETLEREVSTEPVPQPAKCVKCGCGPFVRLGRFRDYCAAHNCKCEFASLPTRKDSSCAHPTWCARWVAYDENHKRYNPNGICSCGADPLVDEVDQDQK